MNNHSYTRRLMAFFADRPRVWIPATELEQFGRQAWRTRLSEARKRFQAAGKGTIENRVRTVYQHYANCPAIQAWDIPGACLCGRRRSFTLSEYRYVPQTSPAPTVGQPHNLNHPANGRLV